ncbi:nitronate monooxygenase family protein [Tabrizicola sp.]|uniref:NAD(P)H-dependent flavin oxidoreductase n=1 Tax=Tabrizicola sp. TaxID=2005166 RepID=UPI00273354A6|nr:nitronate monooxygenase [Tabrizicola sp.]MDP3195458.1 nitronate monooxygenase [Tabrizicola sp.]
MTKGYPSHVGAFLKLIGQSIPIMQAPIGSAATTALAGAVSRAGALGGFALTWANPEEAASAVTALRAATDGRSFFCNFVLHFPCEGFDAALEAGLPIITLSWGIDAGKVASAHRAGALVGIQVASALGARKALDAGADFLIAQGNEAGGHVQSTTPLQDLLPAVLAEAHRVPVIVAGGIATADSVARAIAAGAAGAALGTRFVATVEAAAHDVYQSALVGASAKDTVFTNCFDVGWPFAMHRVLRNDTLTEWEASGCPQAPNRPGEGDVIFRRGDETFPRYSDTPPMPGAVGSVQSACLYAGTGVGDIKAVEHAAELVSRLETELTAALANTGGHP